VSSSEEDTPRIDWASQREPTCSLRIRLTTRWSGPGMRRQKREMITIWPVGENSEVANPGRSVRSR
jgi:hypothetical protein